MEGGGAALLVSPAVLALGRAGARPWGWNCGRGAHAAAVALGLGGSGAEPEPVGEARASMAPSTRVRPKT